jgi:hypothetical protein
MWEHRNVRTAILMLFFFTLSVYLVTPALLGIFATLMGMVLHVLIWADADMNPLYEAGLAITTWIRDHMIIVNALGTFVTVELFAWTRRVERRLQ